MTDNSQQSPTPQEEPSVLDYVKSLFRFGSGERIRLPEFVEEQKQETIQDQPIIIEPLTVIGEQPVDEIPSLVSGQGEEIPSPKIQPSFLNSPARQTSFPWRSLLALVLALLGQKLFETFTTVPLGIAFYIAAFS